MLQSHKSIAIPMTQDQVGTSLRYMVLTILIKAWLAGSAVSIRVCVLSYPSRPKAAWATETRQYRTGSGKPIPFAQPCLAEKSRAFNCAPKQIACESRHGRVGSGTLFHSVSLSLAGLPDPQPRGRKERCTNKIRSCSRVLLEICQVTPADPASKRSFCVVLAHSSTACIPLRMLPCFPDYPETG